MKHGIKLASGAIAGFLAVIALPVGAAQQANRDALPSQPVTSRCINDEATQSAVRQLVAAINTAVRALPPERSSAEDIEATIVYTISQRGSKLPNQGACNCVARDALASIAGGTPTFQRAVSRVRTSLLDCGAGTGTAGLANGGGGNGASFFSAPLAGVGGGSATYSR